MTEKEQADQMRREVQGRCMNCGARYWDLTIFTGYAPYRRWVECRKCDHVRDLNGVEADRVLALIQVKGLCVECGGEIELIFHPRRKHGKRGFWYSCVVCGHMERPT